MWSNFCLNCLPPSFDLALKIEKQNFLEILLQEILMKQKKNVYLRRTPPSREAFRHSGGFNRRWISPTVTLYFEVELSRLRRPGTLQNSSFGLGPSMELPPMLGFISAAPPYMPAMPFAAARPLM
jgi:hypothetical protein